MSINQLKKIKIELISKLKFPPIDIFLYIDNKMIKIIGKESDNYTQELKHYQNKNVSYVFVSPPDFEQMIKIVTYVIDQKSKKVSNLTLEIAEDSYNFLRTKLLYLQISPLEIDDMNRSINQFVSTLSVTPPKFQDKLKMFMARKDYILNHSLMVSYIATMIAKKLDWNNEQIMQKIHYASMFKDIFLENPFLAKIRTLESEEYKILESDQKSLVTGHMDKAIEYLKQIDYLPGEVETMIRQHQELPNGKGFGRGLTADQISPLGCTFNLACYFCQDFLANFEDQSALQVLRGMEVDFDKGNYKNPYKALTQILKGE